MGAVLKGGGNKFGIFTADGTAGTIGTTAILNVSGDVVTTTFNPKGDSTREVHEVGSVMLDFVKTYVPDTEPTEFLMEDGVDKGSGTTGYVTVHMDASDGVNRRIYAQYAQINSAGEVTYTANENVTTSIATTALKATATITVGTALVSAITGKSVQIVIGANSKFNYALVSA